MDRCADNEPDVLKISIILDNYVVAELVIITQYWHHRFGNVKIILYNNLPNSFPTVTIQFRAEMILCKNIIEDRR